MTEPGRTDPSMRAPARVRDLPTWLSSQVAAAGTRLVLEGAERASLRSEFLVLAGVEEFGPVSQAELGRRLGVDRSNVFGVLDRLQHQGAIARRPDPTDRRCNLVEVTDRGRAELDRLAVSLGEAQERFLGPLDEHERVTFLVLLRRLVDHHRNR